MKNFQSVFVCVLFLLLGLFGGYYFGVNGYEVNLKRNIKDVEIINKSNETADSVDFKRFWEVWDMISKEHIKRPLKPNDLLDGAIQGMVKAIGDPYSTYLPIEENQEALDNLNGKYEGIGAQLGFDEDSRLIIVAPLEDSPAEKSGVIAGDVILKIENESSEGLSIGQAVNKIRGEAGTVSHLTLYRKDEGEPFDVKIKRETIKIKSVKWEDKDDGIAYIRLSRFGKDTNSEWLEVAREVYTQMPNLKGVVLDVRNNPGGYLDSAVFVASEFIDNGVIVSEDFSDGRKNDFKVKRKGILIDDKLKISVILNEGSASASEIVAGALKERRDAIIVGKRSFGKGSVQRSEEFSDGAALHVTVAKWVTPDNNWIDKHNSEYKDSVYNEVKDDIEIIGGIRPDVEVDNLTAEDVKENKDPQLERAVEVLKENI